MPNDEPLMMTIFTKFEVDIIYLSPGYSVAAADGSIPPPSLKILRLSVLDLRVATSAIGHH